MIRVVRHNITLRLFRSESEARQTAGLCRHQVDELREIEGGWLYRSGERWYDDDGSVPAEALADAKS